MNASIVEARIIAFLCALILLAFAAPAIAQEDFFRAVKKANAEALEIRQKAGKE